MASSNSKVPESKRSADSAVTHNDTDQDSSNSKDIEFERLVDSLITMLGCIEDDTVKASSISVVPKKHGKSQVEEVYTPRAVSIGPLHRGASTDLLHMEDIKWRCMFYLLHRTPEVENERLRQCTRAMLKLDEIVRASYNVYEIKFNSYDLAKIMLLDGCFLLVLLISGSPSNTQPKYQLEVSKRVAEIIKREVVLSDLTVLENQIPLIILTVLAKVLFPSDGPEMETMLPLFGYSSDSGVTSSDNPAHILELVHSFIGRGRGREIKNSNDSREGEEVRVNINTKKHPNPKPKLKRCATTLEAAGVILIRLKKSGPSHMEKIRFDLNIKFDSINKILEIPQLHITETTEAKWKNFIAWELTKNEDAKSTDAIGSIFIWYALFFQGLLCSVHDIQLLIKKGIIVVYDAHSGEKKKKLSHEELHNLLTFFRNLTKEVDDEQIVKDSHFSWLFQELNKFQIDSRSWYICKIMWHACRCVVTRILQSFRKSFKILIREHITTRWKLIVIVAAVLTFALTFISTFFPDPLHFHFH